MMEDPSSPKTPLGSEFRLAPICNNPSPPPPRPPTRWYKPTDFEIKLLMASVYSLDPEFQKQFHQRLNTPAKIAAEEKRKLKTLISLRFILVAISTKG
ncbi:hypothetical protein O6P43_013108 [Quillaja saponaria]|uniref:Uncharacterized protein n=1 Tax=Quillaja saponaria TaxID=32244 RepID=A0AAD7PUV9_QUISA|nr:hypothetical protein O6P43_013108 [Quillaja saponaria]